MIWWALRAACTRRRSAAGGEGGPAPEGACLPTRRCGGSHKKTKDWINDFGNCSSFPFFLCVTDFHRQQKGRLLSSSPQYTHLCHKHMNLSLKQWTEREENGNGFWNTHRLHPAFQECKFLFFPYTGIYIKRKEEVHGHRVNKNIRERTHVGNTHKNAAGISCKSLFLKCIHEIWATCCGHSLPFAELCL